MVDKLSLGPSKEVKSLENVLNQQRTVEKDGEKTGFFYLKVKIKPQKKSQRGKLSQEYRATEGRQKERERRQKEKTESLKFF